MAIIASDSFVRAVSISSSSLRSFRRDIPLVPPYTLQVFQSPHRAYGHSDPVAPGNMLFHFKFQSPHRAYGHSDFGIDTFGVAHRVQFQSPHRAYGHSDVYFLS